MFYEVVYNRESPGRITRKKVRFIGVIRYLWTHVYLRDKFISFSPNQPTCRLSFYKPPYLLAWCVLCCILVYLHWFGFIIYACIAQNLSIQILSQFGSMHA